MKRLYITYDGRAWNGDTDKASVLVTSDSLEEAIADRENFNDDCVTYSYARGHEYLIDKRLEIMSGGRVVST